MAASLREGGHEVDIFAESSSSQGLLNEIRGFAPDAVAFSVISGEHQHYFSLSKQIREELGSYIIWGGPHMTFFPDVVENPFVDAVCIGEGEEATRMLADRFDYGGGDLPTDVPCYWVKSDGQIYRNLVMPRNRSLDDLPWAARDLYYKKYPETKTHAIKSFMAHRGCPYKCTYCFNEGYNQIYKLEAGDKQVMSRRSPDGIVDEVLFEKSRSNLEMVAFVDDVFSIHRRWTMDFAEVYARRCRLPFSINIRFDNVNEDMVEALVDAGLHLVTCGVESGNEFIRNSVMKRQMTEEVMYDAAALYKKHGVLLLTENILGAPSETYEMALETLKVNQNIRPIYANASLFSPYPKLEITEYAIEKGYFDGDFDKLDNNYYQGSIMEFETERDKIRITNLRCFFGLLTHYPRMLNILSPCLDMKPNSFFRWIGDLMDGWYLKKTMPYRLSIREMLRLAYFFLVRHRRGSNSIFSKGSPFVSVEWRGKQRSDDRSIQGDSATSW